jgi:hypothetical protein
MFDPVSAVVNPGNTIKLKIPKTPKTMKIGVTIFLANTLLINSFIF